MSFHPGAGTVTLAVAVLALLLWRVLKTERRSLLILVGLFTTAMVGQLTAGLLAGSGLPEVAVYVRQGSILAEGLCLISLATLGICRVVMPRLGFRSPRILQDVLQAAAYFGWTLIWLRANRVDLTSIIATSAVVTAVVGFSLQDTLGNILGGIAIQFDQSIVVGDWIRVDDQVGRVVEIRWRHTSIETRSWETVVIPNSYLVKNKFLVLGRRQGEPVLLRRVVPFNVDFRYSPALVTETVQAALRSADIAGLAKVPEAQCLMLDFMDSYGRYAARYWLSNLDAEDPTDSLVRRHVYFALKRAGIPLSIPAQAVFVTAETEERKLSKEEEALAERLEVLHHTGFFDSLQPEELRRVAERLIPAPFARGDVITRQGATAHWLYILAAGEAHVIVENDSGQRTRVAELGPGSIFGEMGLMTGEPRTATVVATRETDCLRLDRESFHDILHDRPAVAEEISELLARRRMELDAALENLNAEARAARLASAKEDILTRIRRFFSL